LIENRKALRLELAFSESRFIIGQQMIKRGGVLMQQPEQIDLKDYQALAEFRYQLRRFTHFSEERARSVGLEPQQHQLLLAVKGLPSGRKATVGKIAERLQIQHHSTVELINRLVERGLVKRQRDEEDHRRVIIHVTEQGEELVQRLANAVLAELHTMAPVLLESLRVLLSSHYP
jgi:DNA-binding MarR family transcriptional regulator